MFCPPGYVPFSKTAVDFDEWSEHLFRSSIALGYPPKLEGRWRQPVHPLGIWRKLEEQIFFLAQCESASICGFDGTVIKIDPLYFLETTNLVRGSDRFPDELIEMRAHLLFAYPETYTVTVQFWDKYFSSSSQLSRCFGWFNTDRTAEVISQFEGWSICLSVEDDATLPEYLVERFALSPAVLEDAKGAYGKQKGQSRRGRPPLSKAYQEFEGMGFDKGTMSWEQLARHLERRTGQKPAAKTMRDWVDRSGVLTASPRGKQGETGEK